MRKIFLHTYGYLHFEQADAPGAVYTAVIDNYVVDDVRVWIKITTDKLCEQRIEQIDTVLKHLGKMHTVAKAAYLKDFKDEEEQAYISGLYQRLLSASDFLQLMQLSYAEQRLMFALSLTSVDISISNESPSITLTYIKGYELVHRYKFNRNFEHTELVLQPGPCIMKEHLSALIDMRELPLVNEACCRFRKDWQNYPVKSYFIYLMVKRIKNYLKIAMQ